MNNNSLTCIVTKEEPTTFYPPDNTLRTVVFYQKDIYASRPRGYYLRKFSLEITDQWETVRMSVSACGGGGFEDLLLLGLADKFSRKKLEEMASVLSIKLLT